jgi:hypothetical protein
MNGHSGPPFLNLGSSAESVGEGIGVRVRAGFCCPPIAPATEGGRTVVVGWASHRPTRAGCFLGPWSG